MPGPRKDESKMKPTIKRTHTVVMGVRFNIHHVVGLQRDEGLLGECDDDLLIIRLDAGLEGDRYKRILRHERVHAALRISGIVEHLSDETEESLARLFETFKP